MISLDRTVTAHYITELDRIFAGAADKRTAHERSRGVLADMAGDPRVITEALLQRVAAADGLCRGHYPVVSLEVATTPHVDVVLNCWLPLPDRATDITTKAIHHHGTMLLTTVTVFGPGYEHWTFTRPEVVDPERELFRMQVIEQGQHGLEHQAFVDAHIAHVPLFVPSLTITLAIWSSSTPTTWKDRIKRVSTLRRNSARLRRLATKGGLANALDLKNIEYFDFYPSHSGFVGMRDRKEFPLGPPVDYLRSICHVVQETGNTALVPTVLDAAEQVSLKQQASVVQLAEDLRAGRPIEPILSPGHFGVPYANFRRSDIHRGLGIDNLH